MIWYHIKRYGYHFIEVNENTNRPVRDKSREKVGLFFRKRVATGLNITLSAGTGGVKAGGGKGWGRHPFAPQVQKATSEVRIPLKKGKKEKRRNKKITSICFLCRVFYDDTWYLLALSTFPLRFACSNIQRVRQPITVTASSKIIKTDLQILSSHQEGCDL